MTKKRGPNFVEYDDELIDLRVVKEEFAIVRAFEAETLVSDGAVVDRERGREPGLEPLALPVRWEPAASCKTTKTRNY